MSQSSKIKTIAALLLILILGVTITVVLDISGSENDLKTRDTHSSYSDPPQALTGKSDSSKTDGYSEEAKLDGVESDVVDASDVHSPQSAVTVFPSDTALRVPFSMILRGKVINDRGAVVAGAQISILPTVFTGAEHPEDDFTFVPKRSLDAVTGVPVFSDERGYFAVNIEGEIEQFQDKSAIYEWFVYLHAEAKGHSPVVSKRIQVATRHTSFNVGSLVLATGPKLAGRVQSSRGVPIRGAKIYARRTKSDFAAPAWINPLHYTDPLLATSDALGHFVIDAIEIGKWTLFVLHPEYAPEYVPMFVKHDERKPITITLDKAGLIYGKAQLSEEMLPLTIPDRNTRRRGASLWDYAVIARCRTNTNLAVGSNSPTDEVFWRGRLRTRLKSDGSYRMDSVPPGTYDMAVSVGRFTVLVTDVVVDEGAQVEVNFQTPEQGSVRGKVMNLDDVPFAHKDIYLSPGGDLGNYDAIPANLKATTDANGEFRLPSVPPGDYSFRFSSEPGLFPGLLLFTTQRLDAPITDHHRDFEVLPGKETILNLAVLERSTSDVATNAKELMKDIVVEGDVTLDGFPAFDSLTFAGLDWQHDKECEIDEDGKFRLEVSIWRETKTLGRRILMFQDQSQFEDGSHRRYAVYEDFSSSQNEATIEMTRSFGARSWQLPASVKVPAGVRPDDVEISVTPVLSDISERHTDISAEALRRNEAYLEGKAVRELTWTTRPDSDGQVRLTLLNDHYEIRAARPNGVVRTYRVSRDRTSYLEIDQVEAAGTLRIMLQTIDVPDGAPEFDHWVDRTDIYLAREDNGKQIDLSTLRKIGAKDIEDIGDSQTYGNVAAGIYRLTVDHPGCNAWSESITVRGGEQTNVDLKLTRSSQLVVLFNGTAEDWDGLYVKLVSDQLPYESNHYVFPSFDGSDLVDGKTGGTMNDVSSGSWTLIIRPQRGGEPALQSRKIVVKLAARQVITLEPPSK